MTPPDDGAALAAQDLTCERGGRRLFEGLSFALAPGDALLLVGPNGSGKSSLLRLLAGLLKPVTGRVLWRGRETVSEPERWHRALAFLGHDDAIKPQLSVASNLAFWRTLHGDRSDTAAALAALDLNHLADLPAGMLSAGQRRRLALARVAARPGGCWLLDEPTANLDGPSSARLMELLARHRGAGGVAVVASHEKLDVEDAAVLDLDTRQ